MFWNIAINEHCDSLPLPQNSATASTCVCFSIPASQVLCVLFVPTWNSSLCSSVLKPSPFKAVVRSFSCMKLFLMQPFISPSRSLYSTCGSFCSLGISIHAAFACGASRVLCPSKRQWELHGEGLSSSHGGLALHGTVATALDKKINNVLDRKTFNSSSLILTRSV